MIINIKKLLVIIFLSLYFIIPSQADDIREFQIEGISIGDSLLDYLSSEKIKSEMERTRPNYNYIDFKYGAVYLYEGLEKYDYLSFFVKPNDRRYLAYEVRGGISYIEDLNSCLKERKEIVEEISKMFKGAKKKESSHKSRLDTSGKSMKYRIKFSFKSGDAIELVCSDWEENLRLKNGWVEGLSVIITTKEVINWLQSG